MECSTALSPADSKPPVAARQSALAVTIAPTPKVFIAFVVCLGQDGELLSW